MAENADGFSRKPQSSALDAQDTYEANDEGVRDEGFFDGTRVEGDESIGLTEAFEPVAGGDVKDYDDPIGLTQAFSAVSGEEDSGPRRVSARAEVWDDSDDDEWHNPDEGEFSTDESRRGRHAAPFRRKPFEDALANTFGEDASDEDDEDKLGAHARGFSYQGDDDEDFPDAVDSLQPVDAPPLLFEERVDAAAAEGRRAHHADANATELPAHLKRSRRVRRMLIVIIILLVLLGGAFAYFAYHVVVESEMLATERVQRESASSKQSTIAVDEGKDAQTTAVKTVSVPDLSAVLGMSLDEATVALAHGAAAGLPRESEDEDEAVRTNVTVSLTEEPVDSKTGTPAVYLGLDEDGIVIQAGYSTSSSSLGYGALSFADAVSSEHVVEKTLREAGVGVADGAAVLPDKATYSTYAANGKTLAKERCSFSGDVEVKGIACTWSAVLSYDYATANLTGNLADTVRVIYVYVTVNGE